MHLEKRHESKLRIFLLQFPIPKYHQMHVSKVHLLICEGFGTKIGANWQDQDN